MARETFFKSIRAAYLTVLPRLANGMTTDAAVRDWAIHTTDLWFTSKAVEGFNAADFSDLPSKAQERLAKAVEQFRHLRSSIAAKTPATEAQRVEGWSYFEQIVQTARDLERREWLASVDRLFRDIEKWSATCDWPTKRYPKPMKDSFLGSYEIQQLLVHRLDGRFIFDPIDYDVAGSDGLIDFYVMPSLSSRSIVLRSGRWVLKPEKPSGRSREWSETAFLAAIQDLSREAA